MTYRPDLDPLGAPWLSALVAALPIITIFITLGLLRWKAYLAGATSLVVALLVAVLAYRMPVGMALASAVEGACYGLFPIVWIVFAAMVLYQVTVASGRFEDLRAVFNLISDDPRVQAMLIAFCFGSLLEALAGFGAPVAITGVMLMACGFSALRAATVVLIANTAPVAFGGIAIPIITAGELTKIPYQEIGAYVGHQTPPIAALVPLFLAFLADGRRGVRETWPLAVTLGLAFAVAKWVCATWVSVEMTDIVASLVGLLVVVLFLRVWRPRGGEAALARLRAERAAELDAMTPAQRADAPVLSTGVERPALDAGRILMALFPYILVVVVFSIAQLVSPIAHALTSTDVKIHWPWLYGHLFTASGAPAPSAVYKLSWLSNPGTLLLGCAVIIALVYRVSPSTFGREVTQTAHKLRFSALTIASVLSLAYVMNQSGQTLSMGTWLAGSGAAFAFLSPVLGWVGTAVTGSDTSANALFATLQQSAAHQAGIDPTLLVAANTSGGVVGKLVSPQNLTIAATAVGLIGQESVIMRKMIGWSLALLALLCLLVGLQSTPVLSWMLP